MILIYKRYLPILYKHLISYGLLLIAFTTVAQSTDIIRQLCPPFGIRPISAFDGDGIIITSFSRDAMWAFDIERNRRFPLQNTAPCTTNCHLSPDATWITFYDTFTRDISMMRLNGDERTIITSDASEVDWWSDDLFLIWDRQGRAHLQNDVGDVIEVIEYDHLVNIQPNGSLALTLRYDIEGEKFYRQLQDITQSDAPPITLGEDQQYFNASAWSPNGEWLAYVDIGQFDSNLDMTSGEIYAYNTTTDEITQWTTFYDSYGAVRINGHHRGGLSWSPDGSQLAFWVIQRLNSDTADTTNDTEQAMIHILDIVSGNITAYCGISVDNHTPNPPHLVWSPDSIYLAFGADLPDNDDGQILLALNTDTGIFTQLSSGLYPTEGSPSIIAWGNLP